MGVFPLAFAFGLPAALVGFLTGAFTGSFAVGIAATGAISGLVTAALARESEASRPVTIVMVLTGLLSAGLFFWWGLSNYGD